MIRTVTVEINSAYPEMPLERAAVYTGSAVSFTILNVPRRHGKREITGVSISLTNASGVITTKAATRDGSAWNVTIPSSAVGIPGNVTNGVIVSASGTMEDGETAATWIIGVGDLSVLNQDGTSSPDAPRQIVHVFSTVPTAPVFGDIAVVDSVLKIRWSDNTWKDMGGGGSITLDDEVTQSSSNGVKSSGIWSFVHDLLDSLTVAWTSITGKPSTFPPSSHQHAKADITDFPTSMTPTAHASTHAVGGGDEVKSKRLYNAGETQYIGGDKVVHISASNWTKEPSTSPASIIWFSTLEEAIASTWISSESEWQGPGWYVSAGYGPGIFAYSSDANATRIDFEDPVTGDTVVFARTLASTETLATTADITSAVSTHNAANDAHADIRTAVGWKVASLVCGSGASQQTITPVNGVANVSTLFTSANTSLTGQINYTIGATGNPADHTVRTLGTLASATTLTIAAPRIAGALRDFAITFTEPSTAVGVTFSTTDAAGSSLTFYGEFLTPADGKTYIYYLTEIAANTFLVKGEEIATVTPPTI